MLRPRNGQAQWIISDRYDLVLHVTVGLDGRISVAEGDRIATQVEQRLAEKIDLLQRVYVHCHPARLGRQEEGKRA